MVTSLTLLEDTVARFVSQLLICDGVKWGGGRDQWTSLGGVDTWGVQGFPLVLFNN